MPPLTVPTQAVETKLNLLPQKPYGTKSQCVMGPRGGVQYVEVPCWAMTEQGDQIKSLRMKLRLTLREAAKRAGMTMADFSSVETGKAIFTDATVFGEVLWKLENRG